MASINIAGDTSGTVSLSAPLVAGTNTVTLPAATGTISLLQMGTAVASTSGTSVNFTGIPSWAKRITVMFNGVSTNGTSNLLIQLGDSSGIETTGYISTAISTSGGGNATSNSTAGFVLSGNNVATNTTSGMATCVLFNGNFWICTFIAKQQTLQTNYAGGDKELSARLDRIRITTVNGTDTFNAGSINVMWEG